MAQKARAVDNTHEEIAEIDRLRKIEAALTGHDEWVLVRLRRIEGYEDVHPELVAEDAIGDRWPEYETLTQDAPNSQSA